jgi:hypothetical protein
MPAPFPGMDPFVEGPDWGDFHTRFITIICDLLVPQIEPRYMARIERRIYVQSGGYVRPIKADIALLEHPDEPRSDAPYATSSVVAEPLLLTLEMPEEIEEVFLTIRERVTREIVTVIEVLSPTNKRAGSGRDEYLTKRHEILRSDANLVEIDLLRGGQRLPVKEALPAADYFAFISRGMARPHCEVYAWRLRQTLPTIPIPLRPGDTDVELPLQAAFAASYDRGGYAHSLDYGRALEPAPNDVDATWIRERLSSRN